MQVLSVHVVDYVHIRDLFIGLNIILVWGIEGIHLEILIVVITKEVNHVIQDSLTIFFSTIEDGLSKVLLFVTSHLHDHVVILSVIIEGFIIQERVICGIELIGHIKEEVQGLGIE